MLDQIVYTYPTINEKIPTGSSVISGNFELREAQDIASILNAGQLDAKVDIAGSEYVGPSLGQKSIDSGAKSFLMALIFVLVYMLFYYFHAGVASNLALIINMFFIFVLSLHLMLPLRYQVLQVLFLLLVWRWMQMF